jgi:hypothetical protein
MDPEITGTTIDAKNAWRSDREERVPSFSSVMQSNNRKICRGLQSVKKASSIR